MEKKILVTGGAGFIGSFLVDELISKGHEVTILDSLERQVHQGKLPGYLNKNAKFVKGDIRDYDTVKKLIMDSDVVFNLAARVGVGQSMYEVKQYVDTNELGTANLLHALANEEHNVKKSIVASSMSIYGEGSYKCKGCGGEFHNVKRTNKQLEKKQWNIKCPGCGSELTAVGTKETKPLSNSSIYAITKKNQEEMTLNIGDAYGIPSVALRFFNAYGPRQSLSNPYTGVAAIFMSRIKNNNAPLVFEDGEQSRDFISVHDIVQGSVLSMEKSSADGEVFNVGTGNKITLNELSKTLIDIFGADLKPNFPGEFRKGDIRHCFSDISKIKSKLGYEPKVSLKDGMQELVNWSQDQEAKDMVDDAYRELKSKKLV
ncbi:MAG: SDR family NAD(P)-dependent oxidoreductase [Nanoarchaeota archaeon]